MKSLLRRLLLPVVVSLLPLSWANAQTGTFLEFNNSSSNTVGGALQTINIAAGGTFVLSLQINAAQATNSLDYWLTQFSGPTTGAFTITSWDFTGSAYPDPSFTGSFAGDTYSNTTGAPFSPDGIIDGRLQPRDGPDLGASTTSGGDIASGLHQVVNLTLQVSPTAASGTYELRSFDYSGFGWSNTASPDNPFDNQAAININVVPEPSTWSLVILGGLGAVGVTTLRRRRRV